MSIVHVSGSLNARPSATFVSIKTRTRMTVAFAIAISPKVTGANASNFLLTVQQQSLPRLCKYRRANPMQEQVKHTRLTRRIGVAMSVEKDYHGRKAVKERADTTKVVTIIVVLATVLYYHNVGAILYTMGSGVNYIIGKVLKKLIRQPRPDGADKIDHGMPSSHATSLSYLSVAALLNVLRHGGLRPTPSLSATVLAVLATVIASRWRVAAGYHTVPQVVVGWIVGCVDAFVWCFFVAPSFSPLLTKLL